MRLPTNKTITDDKTRASLNGYAISHVNAETSEMQRFVPQLYAAVESGNLPEARQLIEKIAACLGSVEYTLEYLSHRTGNSLYTEAEMTKSAECIEKGEYLDDRPLMKKSSRKY